MTKNKYKPRCFFDIKIGDEPAGRIIFELFNDLCPKASENFRKLSLGVCGQGLKTKKLLHYQNCTFHRVIRGFMIQGGDFSNGDGTGGESIFGGTFSDECLTTPHNRPFLLSMANKGPHTNGSQFFITTAAAPHLDGKHVVFGQVLSGQDVIEIIEKTAVDSSHRPKSPVVISNCGELIPVAKKKKKAVSPKDASSNEQSEDSDTLKKKKVKKERKKKKKKTKTSADDEEERLQNVCSVQADEIPEIPKPKFLYRGSSPTDKYAKSFERSTDVSRSGRRVKGRGFLRYQTPSRSLSHSPTPPHWRQAEEKGQKMKWQDRTNAYNKRSDYQDGRDSYQETSKRRTELTNYEDDYGDGEVSPVEADCYNKRQQHNKADEPPSSSYRESRMRRQQEADRFYRDDPTESVRKPRGVHDADDVEYDYEKPKSVNRANRKQEIVCYSDDEYVNTDRKSTRVRKEDRQYEEVTNKKGLNGRDKDRQSSEERPNKQYYEQRRSRDKMAREKHERKTQKQERNRSHSGSDEYRGTTAEFKRDISEEYRKKGQYKSDVSGGYRNQPEYKKEVPEAYRDEEYRAKGPSKRGLSPRSKDVKSVSQKGGGGGSQEQRQQLQLFTKAGEARAWDVKRVISPTAKRAFVEADAASSSNSSANPSADEETKIKVAPLLKKKHVLELHDNYVINIHTDEGKSESKVQNVVKSPKPLNLVDPDYNDKKSTSSGQREKQRGRKLRRKNDRSMSLSSSRSNSPATDDHRRYVTSTSYTSRKPESASANPDEEKLRAAAAVAKLLERTTGDSGGTTEDTTRRKKILFGGRTPSSRSPTSYSRNSSRSRHRRHGNSSPVMRRRHVSSSSSVEKKLKPRRSPPAHLVANSKSKRRKRLRRRRRKLRRRFFKCKKRQRRRRWEDRRERILSRHKRHSWSRSPPPRSSRLVSTRYDDFDRPRASRRYASRSSSDSSRSRSRSRSRSGSVSKRYHRKRLPEKSFSPSPKATNKYQRLSGGQKKAPEKRYSLSPLEPKPASTKQQKPGVGESSKKTISSSELGLAAHKHKKKKTTSDSDTEDSSDSSSSSSSIESSKKRPARIDSELSTGERKKNTQNWLTEAPYSSSQDKETRVNDVLVSENTSNQKNQSLDDNVESSAKRNNFDEIKETAVKDNNSNDGEIDKQDLTANMMKPFTSIEPVISPPPSKENLSSDIAVINTISEPDTTRETGLWEEEKVSSGPSILASLKIKRKVEPTTAAKLKNTGVFNAPDDSPPKARAPLPPPTVAVEQEKVSKKASPPVSKQKTAPAKRKTRSRSVSPKNRGDSRRSREPTPRSRRHHTGRHHHGRHRSYRQSSISRSSSPSSYSSYSSSSRSYLGSYTSRSRSRTSRSRSPRYSRSSYTNSRSRYRSRSRSRGRRRSSYYSTSRRGSTSTMTRSSPTYTRGARYD